MAWQLADFCSGLALEDIPTSIIDATKLHLLDTLGCALAAHALSLGVEGKDVAQRGSGGHATTIGCQQKTATASAALANGMMCHALDFDNTHAPSICHISAVVVPASLASAESAGLSGADLLTTVVAATEVVARIGRAAADQYMSRGFHPTSVFGVFGATAAAAKSFNLGAAVTTQAFGLAGSMSAGLFEYLADGSNAKIMHAGWAAHSGVMAADLAGFGATGPSTILEGRFGLFRAYFDVNVREALIVDGLGDVWTTGEIATKAFPACHFIHSPIDAAARAVGGRLIDPEQVDEIQVVVPAQAVPIVLEPRDAKVAPRTSYDAKFSLQYSVAAMLVHGNVGVTTYVPDAIADPEVLALAERVVHRVKEFSTFPDSFPGGVRIRLKNGEILEAELLHQRGAPENPMNASAIVQKFRDNATLALDASIAAELEAAVLSIEEFHDLTAVVQPLQEAQAVEARD